VINSGTPKQGKSKRAAQEHPVVDNMAHADILRQKGGVMLNTKRLLIASCLVLSLALSIGVLLPQADRNRGILPCQRFSAGR